MCGADVYQQQTIDIDAIIPMTRVDGADLRSKRQRNGAAVVEGHIGY